MRIVLLIIIQIFLLLISLVLFLILFVVRIRLAAIRELGITLPDLPWYNIMTPTGFLLFLGLGIFYLGYFAWLLFILFKRKQISNWVIILGSAMIIIPVLFFIFGDLSMLIREKPLPTFSP